MVRLKLIHLTKELIDVWFTYGIYIKSLALNDNSCDSEIVIVNMIFISINTAIIRNLNAFICELHTHLDKERS